MEDRDRACTLGIYGGTFDPPHHGHRRCIEYALQYCSLVYVVPCGPRSDKKTETSYYHRARMTYLAFGNMKGVHISYLDEHRIAATRTYDLLLEYRSILSSFWTIKLVVGGDCAEDIPKWYRGTELLQLLGPNGLITVPRDQYNSTELREGFKPSWVPPNVAQYVARHQLYRTWDE